MKLNMIALLLLALPACAIATPVQPSNNTISIEAKQTNYVRISAILSSQSADTMVIQGKIKRLSRNIKKWIPAGHIDAILLDSNGEILHETTVEYYPKIIPRKSIARNSGFSLEMPIVAPDNSVLQLSFHTNPHS